MWQLALLLLVWQHPGDPEAKRSKEIEQLVDRARGLAPEFTADILLKLADSPRVVDPAWKQELIAEAFEIAARARNPLPRQSRTGTDTRAGWQGVAQATGLDSLTLRTRAVDAMLQRDRRRARRMFEDVQLPEWHRLSCRDSVFPNFSPFYATLAHI